MSYEQSAALYDRIYSFKDYEAEVDRLIELVRPVLSTDAQKLLDVACGTGRHLAVLKQRFRAHGLDLSPGLLEIARNRNPEVVFHHEDMRSFRLAERFDLITCLFSSIGYATTRDDLCAAISCMADHLAPAGVLAIEPWFTPHQWMDHTAHALFIDDPDLKIARVNTSLVESNVSIIDLHHLVGTPERTVHFVEKHRLGLFTIDEMSAAFEEAGLDVTFDSEGITGRGLYIGRRTDRPDSVPREEDR